MIEHKKHPRHAGYVALMLPIDAEYWNQSDTIEGALGAADEDDDIQGKVGVFECIYPQAEDYMPTFNAFVYDVEESIASSDLCMDEDVFEVKEGAKEAYKEMLKVWSEKYMCSGFCMIHGEPIKTVEL